MSGFDYDIKKHETIILDLLNGLLNEKYGCKITISRLNIS